jgi:GLPGLI family protein
MIKLLVFIGVFLAALPLFAQKKGGKVVYERTTQFGMRMGGVEPLANAPRSRTDRFELSFVAGKQLWEELPNMDEPNEATGGDGGGMMRMRFGSDELIYTNLENSISVSRQELASKNYIVTDTVRKLVWKLSDESKEILGLKARKATATRIGTRMMMAMENGEMKRTQMADTTTITAWFTPEVPVAAGPELSGQLPGLILELELNRGRVLYKAVEISPKINVANIKEPKGGKSITAVEFAQERNRVFAEMRRNGPPGRRMQVTTN